MKENNIIFCNESSIYDISNNKTLIFGQYKYNFSRITIKNIDNSKISLEFHRTKTLHPGHGWKPNHDFCLKIDDKITFIENIKFHQGNNFVEFNNINCSFPFENHKLSLNENSAIISTMCKDYANRLEEWIEYNLKLGFSAIIIFDNDKNNKNPINEKKSIGSNSNQTKEVCDKYKDKVLCIEFPYSPMEKDNWNQIQRVSFHLGVNGFKNQCKNIALIDADEFIHFPRETDNNIEKFLSDYKTTIQFKSNIITNKSNGEHIDNNILKIAKYIGQDKYPKVILDTSEVGDCEFVYTPHHYRIMTTIEKDVLIHYHCWINSRYQWKSNMQQIDLSNL